MFGEKKYCQVTHIMDSLSLLAERDDHGECLLPIVHHSTVTSQHGQTLAAPPSKRISAIGHTAPVLRAQHIIDTTQQLSGA